MSAWRRKALELLPELRQIIEPSRSPTQLWIDVFHCFIDAVEADNPQLVRRVLTYAEWCTSAEAGNPGSEAEQAVFCGFLEDIAQRKALWAYFPDWFTRAQFENYKEAFQYSLSSKDYEQLESIYHEKKRRS